MPFDLTDYVDVRERLAWFFETYPDGSLQADILERGPDYVVVKAVAYRSADDQRPGTGMASEPVPGRTPYTKDSEVMNAETSAWGRALAAIGAPTKGHIASQQEVRTSDAVPLRAGTAASDRSGEGHSVREPSPEHHYPVDPAVCAKNDHKNNRGQQHWGSTIPPDFVERCLMCGTPKLVAMEGTTADLGPAT